MFALLRRLTEVSTHRPKTTLACVFVVIIALSSGAQHLVFDSSEDGFFPDDPSVDLLYEIEGVPEALAREAFRLAHHKLPIKTRFVERGQGI